MPDLSQDRKQPTYHSALIRMPGRSRANTARLTCSICGGAYRAGLIAAREATMGDSRTETAFKRTPRNGPGAELLKLMA